METADLKTQASQEPIERACTRERERARASLRVSTRACGRGKMEKNVLSTKANGEIFQGIIIESEGAKTALELLPNTHSQKSLS